MTMKPISYAVALAAAAACWAQPAAAAGRFDGSAALVCSALVVHECGLGEMCLPRAAHSVSLPALMRVDAKAKKITSLDAGAKRESMAVSATNVDGKLVMHGGEAGRGWAITVHEQNGRLSGAVVTDGEGYVLFGQCAVP